MKRRNFLLSSLLAVPATSLAKFANFTFFKKAKKGFIVRANESRVDGKQVPTGDALLRCMVSVADTDGNLLIGTSTNNTFKQKGGPPLHIHPYQDEVFYIASGEFLIQLADEVFLAGPGDTIFIPKGTPHTFANPIDNNPGMLVTIFQPASKKLEDYFKMLSSGKFPENIEDLVDVGPPIDLEAAMEKLTKNE